MHSEFNRARTDSMPVICYSQRHSIRPGWDTSVLGHQPRRAEFSICNYVVGNIDRVVVTATDAQRSCTWEFLDELLAGGQRQEEYSDFVDRYEQGHPSQGYSDQEVLKRYGKVSHAVPSDHYAQAAQEALSKLSPDERAAFVKMLQDRAAARGVTLPEKVVPEPKELGQVLTDLHQKPGQLRDMLGGEAA